MKKCIIALLALLSPLAFAADPSTVQGEPVTLDGNVVRYSTHWKLLKDDSLMHQGVIVAMAGVPSPLSTVTETPFISGFSRTTGSENDLDIHLGKVEVGYSLSLECLPAKRQDAGLIECDVQVDVTEVTNPEVLSQENQEKTRALIEKGEDVLPLPVVESQSWRQTVVVSDGKEIVIKSNQYTFLMKVRKI